MLADESLSNEDAPCWSRVFLFTIVMMFTMFFMAAVLTLGMVLVMEGLARVSWRSMPPGEYFERPGLILFTLIVMIPAIVVSIAPIDMLGRAVYGSSYQRLFVASSARGGSLKTARQSAVFLRWILLVAWVLVLVAFAASLRWFTWVGDDRIAIRRPWHGSPCIITPEDIRAVYGVDSFKAPNGNVVDRYHPVIELRNGNHIDFSGEADGHPELLARVLEDWSARHGVAFARSPLYPPR